MKKILIENTKIIAIATILSLAVGVASAWTAPTGVAPAGNIEAPLNVSANGQDKKGNLIIEGLNALNVPFANGLIVANGNVGIGTTTPSRKLEVNGDVKINGSIEYKNRLGKPVIHSTSIQTTSGNSQNQKVFTVTPLAPANLLTINNINFTSGGGGSYKITYSDGTSITNTSIGSNGVSVNFPVFTGGYQGSISKVEFFMNPYSCTSSFGGTSCVLSGTVTFSGYETPLGYYDSQKPVIHSTSIQTTSGNSQNQKVFTVTPLTAGNLLTINNITFTSGGGGSYKITYSDGTSITNNSIGSNGVSVNFPDSVYNGSISKVEFFMNPYSCTSSFGGTSCVLSGTVTFSGFETKP